MMRWLRSSPPARAGLAVILIAILALASSLSAGLIAWFSQGDAAAINTAGSVRMETYHLSWKLAAGANDDVPAIIASLQQRLDSPALRAVLEDGPETSLHKSYRDLVQRWNQTLRPAIERGDSAFFQANANAFVNQLDPVRYPAAAPERAQARLAAGDPGRGAVQHHDHPADRPV